MGALVDDCPEVCSGDTCNNDTLNITCKNNTCFKWITGDYVNAEFMLPRFGEEKFAKRECLSFARNDHQLPSFVNLYCQLKRPYLCQRPPEEEDGEMTHRKWIRIGGYEYAIFYAKKTWKESVRECFSKHKAHLANFRTMEEVTGIGKYLLTGRPSLENAWIGGHYKEGQWRYISIDDIIPDERNPETMYPPWPETNETLPQEGCLLLDRHLQDEKKLVFLQARCHRRKSYICSRSVAGGERPPFETIIIDNVCYTLFYGPKTWYDANRTCHERNAWLVEVTSDKVDHILYIMGENRTEINHIWIGGKLKLDNKWYWVKTNDIIESDNNKIFNGYPPWLDTVFDQKYACLNMDRENHNRAIFYGVYCEVKQPFICQQYEGCPIKPDHSTTVQPTTTPKKDVESTTVITTTTPRDRDIWKWKWPKPDKDMLIIKPYFNWTNEITSIPCLSRSQC
ncbi:hypothetical protein ILUMI_09122 [Ignelater luminosus]|uniref:C-type lectin domain-containing protein n=1 Tax=Ignelater luminosus TaxID=2038154 RepID=A0A8K0D6D1_IGNLU|nr:hypothetical protein ILUMI_09122 [Ignelater luminosus]